MPTPASQGTPPPFSPEMPIIAPTTRPPIQPPIFAVAKFCLETQLKTPSATRCLLQGLRQVSSDRLRTAPGPAQA